MKRLINISLMIVAVATLLIFGLSFLVPVENNLKRASVNRVKLKPPDSLSVADFCYLGENFYFVFNNSSKIYKIINDSITAQWGEYGIGNLKFHSPRRIKNFNQKLFVSDVENLQVQCIDTSGKFLGIHPKRNTSDFLFLSEKEKNISLRDFFINHTYFILCFGEYYKQKVAIYHRERQDIITLPDKFSLISAIDYDPQSSTVFIADASVKTIYAYTTNGKLIYSTGLKGKKDYLFDRIEDMIFFNGKLYILDVYVDGTINKKGFGLIHVFDANLSSQGVLGKKDALFMPKAIEFMNNDKEIAVINRDGNELRFIKNNVE